jgi:hypothetical protein
MPPHTVVSRVLEKFDNTFTDGVHVLVFKRESLIVTVTMFDPVSLQVKVVGLTIQVFIPQASYDPASNTLAFTIV